MTSASGHPQSEAVRPQEGNDEGMGRGGRGACDDLPPVAKGANHVLALTCTEGIVTDYGGDGGA